MPNDVPPDETRMRAALGLMGGSQPRPSGHRSDHRSEHGSHRHRFVRDGEVAVTVINQADPETASAQSPRSRLMAAEDSLAAERSSHARTRRALEEALATIQALETKHAHDELAHAEAIRHEQSLRAQAEAALQQLQEADMHAPRRVAAATKAPREAELVIRPSARAARRPDTASGAAEPEPVEWWVPGWRTKIRR